MMDTNLPKSQLLDSAALNRAISSVAKEISSEFLDSSRKDIAFIGIQAHGVPFARRVAAAIKADSGFEPPVGSLDISMYRDDIGMRKSLPVIRETIIPFDLDGRIIILTDDVLQTGRTIRAALDALTDYGRPDFIRLAVLIDRGLREFPIRADYTGKVLSIDKSKRVRVRWAEDGGDDSAWIEERRVAAV